MARYHPALSSRERKRTLKAAKTTKSPYVRPVLGQQKLEFKAAWMDSKELNNTKSTSRNMERFPSDHEELVKFKCHLMGIGGKKKSSASADAIVTEISKMLYFAGPDELKWDHLTNISKLKLYMEKMDALKIGPEGQLTKLERVCDAVDYLKFYYQDGRLASQIGNVELHIGKWKKVLRAEKQQLQATRIEKLADQDIDLKAITDVVDNPRVWSRFDSVIEALQKGEGLSDVELKVAMGTVAITLVLESYQRPGAVCNCTIEEYRNAVICDDIWVIRVHDHKTSKHGTAKLLMDPEMKGRVDDYFQLVRPKLAEPTRPKGRPLV